MLALAEAAGWWGSELGLQRRKGERNCSGVCCLSLGYWGAVLRILNVIGVGSCRGREGGTAAAGDWQVLPEESQSDSAAAAVPGEKVQFS